MNIASNGNCCGAFSLFSACYQKHRESLLHFIFCLATVLFDGYKIKVLQ
jgi:hypothetical protein